MVITYEDSEKAVRALYTLRESKHEDKDLLGKYHTVIYSTRGYLLETFVKWFDLIIDYKAYIFFNQ